MNTLRGTSKHGEEKAYKCGTPVFIFTRTAPYSVCRKSIAVIVVPHLCHSSYLSGLQTSSDMISLDLCLSVSFFFLFLYFYLKKWDPYSSLPLPPGPKGWPVIGNLLNMPTEFEWKTYHEWCKKFSMFCFWFSVIPGTDHTLTDTDILHVPVLGTNIIVLDTPEAVTDLLEQRSSIYSDRYTYMYDCSRMTRILTIVFSFRQTEDADGQ